LQQTKRHLLDGDLLAIRPFILHRPERKDCV
jgi:hypothetical protein